MAKRIMQFRYYKDNHEDNQPKAATLNDYANGSVFESYAPFVKIGIQTLPNTKFYLNGSLDGCITVGPKGVFELDLEGFSEIVGLRFDRKSMDLISGNPNGYLIIDVIYDR